MYGVFLSEIRQFHRSNLDVHVQLVLMDGAWELRCIGEVCECRARECRPQLFGVVSFANFCLKSSKHELQTREHPPLLRPCLAPTSCAPPQRRPTATLEASTCKSRLIRCGPVLRSPAFQLLSHHTVRIYKFLMFLMRHDPDSHALNQKLRFFTHHKPTPDAVFKGCTSVYVQHVNTLKLYLQRIWQEA